MSFENTTPDGASFKSNLLKSWVPVILSAFVGLVLLVSGFQKAFEIDLFLRQIRDYEIITNPLLIIFSGWGLIIFECCLGTSLLINYKPKIAIPAGSAIFLMFVAATGYAWATGVTDDCGCFGSWLERTPKEAMVEDLVLLGALAVAWKWNRSFKKWPFHLKEILIGVALLAGLLVPLLVGPLFNRISSAVTGPVEDGLETFVLEGFSHKDLSTGKHIILIMATDCSHCRAEMDNLNMLAEVEGLPDVIALTMNSEDQVDDFNFEFEPAFKFFQIPGNDFWRLLDDGDIPRIILINNGKILKKWDFAVPEIDEIKAQLPQ